MSIGPSSYKRTIAIETRNYRVFLDAKKTGLPMKERPVHLTYQGDRWLFRGKRIGHRRPIGAAPGRGLGWY